MLKTPGNTLLRSGYRVFIQVQPYIDQARALGRQVISGEVAADRAVAPDNTLELDGRTRR